MTLLTKTLVTQHYLKEKMVLGTFIFSVKEVNFFSIYSYSSTPLIKEVTKLIVQSSYTVKTTNKKTSRIKTATFPQFSNDHTSSHIIEPLFKFSEDMQISSSKF